METIFLAANRSESEALLEMLAGRGETSWCGRPEEACARMRAARGEAVALLMEGADGPPAEELLARFRNHCPASEHHTVLLLRRAGHARVGRLLAAGADDCLRLPLEPEELERRLMVAAAAAARGRRLRDSLREEGLRDPETRLLSRGAVLELLDAELSRSRRHGLPVGLALIRMDRFDRVLLRLGQAGGELALQAVSASLLRSLRTYDPLGRCGPEEFMAILPGCGPDASRRVSERLRERVEEIRLDHFGRLTVSVGVSCPAAERETSSGLVQAAREALERASRLGRNRVVTASGNGPAAVSPADRPNSRILVIDDSAVIRGLCRLALAEVGDVRVCAGLEEAAPFVEEADLVVTDLQMPGAGGLQVLEHLRARGVEVPVLVITGCDPDLPELDILRRAGVPCLRKPFPLQDLLGSVRQLLGAKASSWPVTAG